MNTEIISEKRKPGRPRLTSPEYDVVIDGMIGEERTRRSHLNWLHGSRAHSRLVEDPNFDYDHICSGKRGDLRITILAELERIEDNESMYLVARKICEDKLSTSKAIALIRRVRFRNDDAPDERLADMIFKTINDHLARYPTTTPEDILAALDDVVLGVKLSNS